MDQTVMKGIQQQAWLGWKGDLSGIVQETKVWLYWQIEYA